jgi:large subunit ribosomal protein L25
MAESVIHAKERKTGGTRASRQLRQLGRIPGVVYGHGQENLSIDVDARDFLQTLHARTRMFDLQVDGRPDEKVLVKDLQYDSMGDVLVHVDLLRVDLAEQVEVSVPVALAGHPVGVVQTKGILDQPLHELRVRCLPLQIPNELRVAVAHLAIGMMILVKDVALPEGVVALNAPEQVVAIVHPPVAEEEVAPAAAEEGPAEPEVIGEKERLEAEAAAAAAAEGKPEKRAKAEKSEKKEE